MKELMEFAPETETDAEVASWRRSRSLYKA